jgi:5,10-methylenetetrahydrofolate reductase
VLPPLDWDKTGTSAFADLRANLKTHGGLSAVWRWATARPEERRRKWEAFFREVRQPAWWSGDDLPHPAPPHEPVSSLERVLASGGFAITVEISPPLTADPADVVKKVQMLKDYVDAVNFTDNPSATPRMSSLACSLIALQNGVEPVLQVAARDRTRMGLQGEVLGATALGIRNILCLTGDHPRTGPPPNGRMDIWDLDAIQMLWIIRQMRDEGRFLDCREIKCAPQAFLGAAGSPNSSTPLIQAIREEKKVNAGAQFLQTNLVFDYDRFVDYLEALERREVTARTALLVGISPIRSVKAAHYMNAIPGVRVPEAYIKRMEASADPKEESVQMTLELIDKVKRLPGVRGLHFMSVTWESIVPRLITESGLGKNGES